MNDGTGTSRPPGASSRELLLEAARAEFADRGYAGARVDAIARRAGVNKQLLYHHYGNKEDLYAKVLERAYDRIRDRERALDLAALDPSEALQRLTEMSFDYLVENRDFVSLIVDENIHKGRHLGRIAELQRLNTPLLDSLGEVLRRGAEAGKFRPGLDPLQVYLSIAGLGFFYFSNVYTLNAIFGRTLDRPEDIAERRRHVVDFVLNAVRV